MNYLSDRQLVDLAAKLLHLTREGNLDWKPSEGNDYRFKVRNRKYGYAISSRDQDDLHPYELEIWSFVEGDQGRLLQETLSPDVNGLGDIVGELYALVKRSVLGVDEVAQDLFDELDELGGNRGP